MKKIILVLSNVILISCMAMAGTVVIIKNPDGSITKQEIITAPEIADKKAELERQKFLLEAENTEETNRIAIRQAQIDDLKKQIQDITGN